ncbi:MAG TPA: DUF2061 domain-containing protein [Candidatus Nanopelagicaceae bacterium]|jgi:uncharacterized membrane protein|nr:DUF2061 domain-containing protein [Candidatus Nanopelagicaceae bacterium]
MKLIQKLKKKKDTIKESFFKSVIYRIITIFLGMLVIFIVTGNLIAAFSIGFATETIQFINYFFYEAIWTNYHDKRLRIKIERTRKVDINLDFDQLKDISFEFSQTDTYAKEAYESILSFFENLIQNEILTEIREDIQRDKNYFESRHKDRSFMR